MVREQLAFDDAVNYTRGWKSKVARAEGMGNGLLPVFNYNEQPYLLLVSTHIRQIYIYCRSSHKMLLGRKTNHTHNDVYRDFTI